jgi:hypothetical protein
MSNDKLLEEAEKAINDLFSDMSVSREKCRENMRELLADIEIKIESLGLED